MQHESELLNTRQNSHGDIRDNADCFYDLRRIIEKYASESLKAHTKLVYPLDMIAMKLARIVTGDCTYDDHWIDLSGYSELGRKLSKEPV